MTSVGLDIHKTAIVAPNVELGLGSVVGEYVILGRPPRGKSEGEVPLVIGPGAVIRPFTTIYAGSRIGARLQTGQGASIREDNVIGDDVSIGTHASIEFGNRIGSRVRVHTGCFLELVVRKGARIGANSTILPGIEIGADALVGAGSVVRKPVPARAVWAGNPAVEIKDEITKLACFAGIFPHAYSWLDEKAGNERAKP